MQIRIWSSLVCFGARESRTQMLISSWTLTSFVSIKPSDLLCKSGKLLVYIKNIRIIEIRRSGNEFLYTNNSTEIETTIRLNDNDKLHFCLASFTQIFNKHFAEIWFTFEEKHSYVFIPSLIALSHSLILRWWFLCLYFFSRVLLLFG